MTAPLLYETHSHTPLCKHATGTPSEYAEVAHARGLRGLTVTCHNPMPDGFSAWVRMDPEEFPEYCNLVAATREEWSDKVDVLLGLEADYFEGYEGYVEEQLKSAEFNYVLGSVHPQLAEFKAQYPIANAQELHRKYFELLAQAAETRLFDTLAHPDLIKNETPNDWRPDEIMDDILRALDRIAATGTAMELNTSGQHKKIREMNPFPEMLKEMRQRDIPVVVGADAHNPARVGDKYPAALELLYTCGYSHVSYFVGRRRVEVAISAALESLKACQEAA